MKIGVFEHGWWLRACRASRFSAFPLPIAQHPTGNAYAADLAARMGAGAATVETSAQHQVDLLLDNGGTGLGFVPDPGKADELKLAHEAAGVVLCSHFIDPLTTVFQGLDWAIIWQCLQSRSWVKAVWDRAQVLELQRFGVPNVIHLPMAAPDRPYDTQPLDPTTCKPVVSFVGGQNTGYFTSNAAVPSGSLLAGTLAQAVCADQPGTVFFNIYHDLYGLGEAPREGDPWPKRLEKAIAYFNAKLFFNAGLCIRNRDRFVVFLKRCLGDEFHLAGPGWDRAYGLPAAPRFETTDAYLNHFRNVAINLNLVNGNAETGLNMRHFEITAAGGFMLCYDQPELHEHFEVGKECAVFHNEAELLEQIRHYLSHPDERVVIARAGQERTLSRHLYSHRLQSLLHRVGPAMRTTKPVAYSTTNVWEELKALVPEPKVVLDCGANVGQTARSLRNAYPHAEIYSFEPVQSIYKELVSACEPIAVHPVRKAVGDHDGTATIHLTASPEANSLLPYQEGNPCAPWTRVVGSETVDVCTLESWCREANVDPRCVDIIKLDVQGAELQALYGARKLLDTAKLVYLEVSFVPIYKDAPLFGEIDGFLTRCGYRRHAIFPSDQPHHWGDALYVKAKE